MLKARKGQPNSWGSCQFDDLSQTGPDSASRWSREEDAYLGRWLNCCKAGSPEGARCTGSHRGRTRRSGSAPADPDHTSGNTRSTGTTPQLPGRLRERDSVGGKGHLPESCMGAWKDQKMGGGIKGTLLP